MLVIEKVGEISFLVGKIASLTSFVRNKPVFSLESQKLWTPSSIQVY